MSVIDDLISRLCPEGVEHRPLSELARTVPGLRGKTKADFSGGTARFVSYKNVYNNPAVDQTAQDFVTLRPGENQNELHVGDVLVTGSSENIDDVGMSSVVVTEPAEPLYLNSFCFGLRFSDPAQFVPEFTKHLFRSEAVRAQIRRSAQGVTRINISKARFMKVRIPLPPIEVQSEVARVLEQLTALNTELATELRKELAERRRQYDHFRAALLTFADDDNAIRRVALGDIGELVRGNGMPKTSFTETGVGAIHYGQIYTYFGTSTKETIAFVAPETAERLRKVDPGDVIITNTSENLEDVGKAVAWLGDEQIVTGGHATILKHDQDPRFVAHWFQSPSFQRQKKRLATGTKVMDVSAKQLAKVEIPLPDIEAQREIVQVLERFHELETELETELRTELRERERQLGYHVDDLLSFGEVVT